MHIKTNLILIGLPQNRKPRFCHKPRFCQQKGADQKVDKIGVRLYHIFEPPKKVEITLSSALIHFF